MNWQSVEETGVGLIFRSLACIHETVAVECSGLWTLRFLKSWYVLVECPGHQLRFLSHVRSVEQLSWGWRHSFPCPESSPGGADLRCDLGYWGAAIGRGSRVPVTF